MTEVNTRMRKVNSIKYRKVANSCQSRSLGRRVLRADKELLLCNNVNTFLAREEVVKTLDDIKAEFEGFIEKAFKAKKIKRNWPN